MTTRERTGTFVLLGAAVVAGLAAWLFGTPNGPGRMRVAWDRPHVERDFEMIAKDTLRVLVLADPLTWEVRPKAVTGLEFELLERFAERHQLPMITIPMEDPDSMWSALQTGRGDVMAAQYSAQDDHDGWAALTAPYQMVRPMQARLREDHLNVDPSHSVNDTLVMSRWSPFLEDRVGQKSGRSGSGTLVVAGTPEELLMDVVLGRRHGAVVTDAIASHEGQRFPVLEFTPLDGPQRALSFVVRSNAPDLLARLDEWIGNPAEVVFRQTLADTYMSRLPKTGALRKRSMPANADSISPYDADFREYGNGFGWKWQLLAAMAWKESRFDSSAVSHMGAHGIMQFMPRTAAHYGVDSSLVVADHINAAKRYIGRLDTMWMRAVPDREQRLRFVLASYNAGLGHIIDAQRLAEHLGLDPERWEHHVERAVLLLAKPRYYMRPEMKNGFCKGSQVFHYVRDVVALYNQLTGLRSVAKKDVPQSEKEG